MIPFEVCIPEAQQDKQLLVRLRAEWPGILTWCVEGCRLWQAEGLVPPNDVTSVLAFWRDASAEPSSTDDSEGVIALLEHSPGALVLAIENDAIVGSVIAGWDGWRGALYRLAVEPSCRRRGIATALVEAAEQQLHANGVRRMHLIVSIAGGEGSNERRSRSSRSAT